MSNQFRLVTALAPQECVLRLQAATQRAAGLPLGYLSQEREAVIGEVRADGFLLCRRIVGRNSFSTYAIGTIQSADGGSLVEVSFGAHPGFRWAPTAWGCLVLFMGVPYAWSLLHSLPANGSHESGWRDFTQYPGFLVLTLVVFPPFMYMLSRGSTKGDDLYLLHFLMSKLEAREA